MKWETLIESFSFWDEDDNEYEILSIAHAWASVILAGKHDSVVILRRVLARMS